VPVTIKSGKLKLASGTAIVWSVAVGAYVIVEASEIIKDPGNTTRDLAPTAAFSSAPADTGAVLMAYTPPDTVLDQIFRMPPRDIPGVTLKPGFFSKEPKQIVVEVWDIADAGTPGDTG
jgi:hypothetical protein